MRKDPVRLEDAVLQLRAFGVICTPRQLTSVIGGQPYYLNVQARNGTLPYDYYWSGKALKIYTESVIKRITGGAK